MIPAASKDSRSRTLLPPRQRRLENNRRGVHRRADRYTRDLRLRSAQAYPWEIGSSQVAKSLRGSVGRLSRLPQGSHLHTLSSRSLHPRLSSVIPRFSHYGTLGSVESFESTTGVVSEGDITSMESVRAVWLPGMDSNHDSRLQRP